MFLTVNLIDRFLERKVVIRKKLQLVGVTAMLIACKYEEVLVPTVEDFVLITDKAYTRNEVLNMVSQFVHFNLSFLFFPLIFKNASNQQVPVGETNGKHLAIQLVCDYSLRVHEKIS